MTDTDLAPAVTINLPELDPDARARAAELIGTAAPLEPDGTMLRGPCLVRAGGELVAAVLRLSPGPLAWARKVLLAYPADTSTYRGAGIRNRGRTFGNLSRMALLQRDGCRACEGAISAPEAHEGIVRMATIVSSMFADAVPELAARDEEAARAVGADWHLGGSQWTSGVANMTSVLPYHYDRNNLQPVWSAMIVVRRGVRGGYLHVPELGASFHCRDGDVVCFPGWRFVHGVTPCKVVEPDGYRISAVYYCVSRMRHCGTPEAEVARAQKARTNREANVGDVWERIPGRRDPDAADPLADEDGL